MSIIRRTDQMQNERNFANMPSDCIGKFMAFLPSSENLNVFPTLCKRIYACFKEQVLELSLGSITDKFQITLGKNFPNLQNLTCSKHIYLVILKINKLRLTSFSCFFSSCYAAFEGRPSFPSTLKQLTLNNSGLIDEHLLAFPTSLISLEIKENPKISDKGLKTLQALTNLLELDLSYCREISDEGCLNLPKTLESLVLTGCNCIQGLNFSYFLELKKLNLSECYQITDSSLRNLPSSLITITLSETNTNACFEILPQSLQSLSSDSLYLNDDAFDKLPKKLKYLNLSTSMITGCGFFHLTSLTELHCSGSSMMIMDETFKIFPHSLTKLEFKLIYLTDSALESFPPNLLFLSLHGASITDIGLRYLQRLPLQSLELFLCDNLTDRGLVYLQQMPFLTFLSLNRNEGISANYLKDWFEFDLENNFRKLQFQNI